MAESAVSFVAKSIADLLVQEAVFLGKVADQVVQLQTELGRMQCFLKDADKRQDKEEAVRGWVSEIRELAYKAEALLETFALKLTLRRAKGFTKTCKRYASIFINGADIHTLGVEIKGIIDKIHSLTTNLQTYGIKHKDELEGSTNSRMMKRQQMRKSYSHLVEENPVGLEIDTKILLGLLVDVGPKRRQTVAICGMGGLGKTTLATELYHHDTVRGHFDAFAWTCVSQQFQVREVLEEILVKLSSSDDKPKQKSLDMDDGDIAKKLYQMQKDKKCLVILDDVWNVECWGVLKHAFPMGNIAGMVVITTRNKALAVHVDPNVFIHEPQMLSDAQGWELIRQKLFYPKTDNYDFSNKERIGKQMVRRCSGLPLAVKVLGKLLATKRSLSEWNSVHVNVNLHLKRGQERSDINDVLVLSYYDLSYRLKSCFLYLSYFPEDYSIPCKKLYRLWIAEGIVAYNAHEVIGEETLEDRAEIYLQELIDRSMVQVCETGSTGRVKSCRLHDLIRELCMLKANEENFLDVVHSHKKNETTSDTRLAHRLAVYVKDEEIIDINQYTDAFYLRSLLIVNKENIYKENIVSFGDFQLLKVLSLRRCLVHKQSSKQIGQLIFLKYLAFEQCVIESLPPSIGNLKYLQTLIVENQLGYKTKIPNELTMLDKLRHLCLSGVAKFDDDIVIQLRNLSDIQTLEIDDIKLFDLEDIKQIVKLRKFVVRLSYGHVIEQLQGAFLKHLSTLYIKFFLVETETEVHRLFTRCHRVQKLKLEGNIEKLPAYQNFPSCLTKLSLTMSLLKEDPMTTLEKLPELTTLTLDCAFEGTKMVCSSKGFPRLKTLFLHHLHELVEWQVDEEAMPNLQNLQILSCGQLKMVPDGLEFITTLCNFVIICMPIEFTNRVRIVEEVEGQDFYKVRHVPSIKVF